MKCPVCKDVTLSMSSRNEIEIDFCPTCRGVWLDRGELDKIIEKSLRDQDNTPEREAPSPARPQVVEVVRSHPADDYHRQGSYKYKRKKSFLEELFD
jgi:Zn-finger nucleic acid-binding protein